MSPAGTTQPVQTREAAASAGVNAASPHDWLHALRMAFLLAVRGLESGKLPPEVPRTQVLLTHEEFRAVLDAARTAVTRRGRRAMR